MPVACGGAAVLPGYAVLADADGRFTAQVPTPGLYELHAHHSEWGGGQVKVTAPARTSRVAGTGSSFPARCPATARSESRL